MTTGDWFMAAGSLLYLGGAISYYYQGVFPLTVVYTFYAGANAGMIWLAHWRMK